MSSGPTDPAYGQPEGSGAQEMERGHRSPDSTNPNTFSSSSGVKSNKSNPKNLDSELDRDSQECRKRCSFSWNFFLSNHLLDDGGEERLCHDKDPLSCDKRHAILERSTSTALTRLSVYSRN